MNQFEVRVSKDVIKRAKKLPKAHREKLAKFIEVLKENPIPIPEFDIKPVKGKKKKNGKRYRLRLGDYRVFYDIYWEEKIIIVLRIEPRERAYSRR